MQSIEAQELKQWIEEGRDFELIDIRESWERMQYNIGGKHIPMGDFSLSISDVAQNKPVVVYCEHGVRTGIIIQRFGAQLPNMIHLKGGIAKWKALHLS
jgi:rhodanese-related sulfurtransferase